MGLSTEDSLACARRIYVNNEKPETVAKEFSIPTRLLHTNVRSAIPRLISENDWDIPAAIEHLGGRELPLEMRKEIQKFVKNHGLVEAARLTTCSVGSAARWGRGEFGTYGVQEMGKLPWKSMLTGDTTVTKKRRLTASEAATGKKVTNAIRRQAVYRMVTERPEIIALAKECGVTVTSLYNWRIQFLGKVGTKKYKSNCEAFIAEFSTAEDPKPLVIHRNNQVVKKAIKRRQRYSQLFKRDLINRWENHNESLKDLITSSGVTGTSIYSWRREILGKKGTRPYDEKARELAQEFVEAAQVDDVVTHANGRDSEPPELQQRPDYQAASAALQRLPIENLEATVTNQPDAILASVEQIDRHMLSLQKDRQLLVQQLEIQTLRREIAQNNS